MLVSFHHNLPNVRIHDAHAPHTSHLFQPCLGTLRFASVSAPQESFQTLRQPSTRTPYHRSQSSTLGGKHKGDQKRKYNMSNHKELLVRLVIAICQGLPSLFRQDRTADGYSSASRLVGSVGLGGKKNTPKERKPVI